MHESKQVRTSTKRLRVILDAKYEKSDLNKVDEKPISKSDRSTT